MESSFTPRGADRLLRGLHAPWWVADGWALDLWLGRQTREHLDLDIAILRRDQWLVRQRLDGWDLCVAEDGMLSPLANESQLEPPRHAIWCRAEGAVPWAF
jgi:hypothetical protein